MHGLATTPGHTYEICSNVTFPLRQATRFYSEALGREDSELFVSFLGDLMSLLADLLMFGAGGGG
jgi:hypothetical protein